MTSRSMKSAALPPLFSGARSTMSRVGATPAFASARRGAWLSKAVAARAIRYQPNPQIAIDFADEPYRL